MTYKEFEDYLKKMPKQDMIVALRYKYSWEKEWTYSNEILEVDNALDDYIWLYDWNEGQQEVEILASVPINDIDVIAEAERLRGIIK